MPPKKRLRGPKLPVVQEELSAAESAELAEGDTFDNEQEEDTDVMRGVRNMKIGNSTTAPPGPVKPDLQLANVAKFVKRCVIDSFRMVFQCSFEDKPTALLSALQKMMAAHRKSLIDFNGENAISAFLDEIDVRLCMMVEDSTLVEHRARTFKLVAMTATQLIKQDKGDFLLKFLFDFIEAWGQSDNVAARTNTVSIINYLFESSNNDLPNGDDRFCGFSINDSERLFLQMKRALYDRDHNARVAAIRGMAYLQGQPIPSNWGIEAQSATPRELLMRSFRDTAWEARLVAIQEFKPKESDVMVLSDIVYYDKCLNVRIAALNKFGILRPNKFVREKVNVLELCMKDHELAIRDAAKAVVKAWVSRLSQKWIQNQKPKETEEIIETKISEEQKTKGYILSGQALVLLWLSDYPESTEAHSTLRRIVTYLLDSIRLMYVCQAEPLSTFAEVIMGDLRDKMIENAVPIITKSTIGSILEDSELLASQDMYTNRAMIFFWRSIVDYIVEKKRNDADKLNALMRFLSPLKTMVDHLTRTLGKIKALETGPNHYDLENYVEETYILQMSMVENILSVMRHTQVDQPGLDAYKAILTSMLMNFCYQKKIVDLIVIELSQFYKDCPDHLMSLMYSKINEMRRNFKFSQFPILEGTQLIGEKKLRADYEEEARKKGRKTVSDRDATKIIDFYELMVVNSILKTGILKEWDSEYESRYGKMFEKGLESNDLDTRVLACECIGIIGIYNLDQIEDHLGEILGRFGSEEPKVKGTMITVLTDLYIEHGDALNQIIVKHCREKTIAVLLGDLVHSFPHKKESETLLRAVEGLVKMLLNTKIDPTKEMWQRVMVTLMYRASFTIIDRFTAQIRSTIIVALKFFCTISKANQMLVIKSFRRFFDLWSSTSTISNLAPNPSDMIPKLKRCAAAFVALTRHSCLTGEDQRKLRPAHVDLVEDILTELTSSPDSPALDYCLYSLHYIEYSSFGRVELNKIYGDLENQIGIHDGEEDDRARCNELRRISKKVAKVLGLNEEDMDEPPSKSSEQHKKSSKNKKKSKEDEEENEEDGEEKEDEEEELPEVDEEEPVPAKKRAKAPPRSVTNSATKKKTTTDDAIDILKSPPRNTRKPPSRPATGSRPTAAPASSTRSAMPRSARKLRSDK